jgi:hypothetical protein
MFVTKIFKAKDAIGNHSLHSFHFTINKFRNGCLDKFQEYIYSWLPRHSLTKECTHATQSGPVTKINGQTVQVYEHEANDVATLFAVFTRQLKTGLRPDARTVNKFRRFCKKRLDILIEEIFKNPEKLLTNIKTELSKKKSWSNAKKKTYWANSFKTLNRASLINNSMREKHYYTAMVKQGEKYVLKPEHWQQFIHKNKQMSDRARLIFCPEGEIGKGLLTMMQGPLLKQLKKILPGFCHSMNSDDMSKHVNRVISEIPGDLVSVCTDGSNHDGHQHWSLIDSVDNYFFKKMMQKGWFEYALKLYDVKNMDAVKQNVSKVLFEKTATLKGSIRNEPFQVKITGTTFSGSPCRTTLGNTLRVMLYWAFVMDELGLKTIWTTEDLGRNMDAFVFVSGDDQVMWTSKDTAELLKNNYLRWFSDRKDEHVHGLGQCVTEFEVRNFDDVNFCSKISRMHPKTNKIVFLRDPRKIFTHSSFHRYCSELNFMPSYLHSEMVAWSIRSELQGHLARAYANMRCRATNFVIRKGKKAKRSNKSLFYYLQILFYRRGNWNVRNKISDEEKWVDEWMREILDLTKYQYVSLTLQCLSDVYEINIVQNNNY